MNAARAYTEGSAEVGPAEPHTREEWSRWLDRLPGGDMSEKDATALACETVDEVRAELYAERKQHA